MVDAMRNDTDSRVRIAAAKIILERGFGLPKELPDSDERPVLNAEERIAMLQEIAARMGYAFTALPAPGDGDQRRSAPALSKDQTPSAGGEPDYPVQPVRPELAEAPAP